MREYHNIRQPCFFEHLNGHRAARHLHQAKNTLLHARAARRRKQDKRTFQFHRALSGCNDCIANIHAHRAAHKRKILRRSDDRGAPDFALGHQHGFFFAGIFLGCFHSVRVFFLIPKIQRIGDGFWHGYIHKNAAIKQAFKSGPRADPHMMPALGANVQILAQLAVKQHAAAVGAFGPEVLGHFAPREN